MNVNAKHFEYEVKSVSAKRRMKGRKYMYM